jgi:hypothetical protein
MPRVYTKLPLEERFFSHVNKDGPIPPHRPELGPCWVWTAATNEYGYGLIAGVEKHGHVEKAHRVAFLIAEGRWPEPCGLHKCDNPPCCKAVADEKGPAHIFEGTQAENLQDMHAKGRASIVHRTHWK